MKMQAIAELKSLTGAIKRFESRQYSIEEKSLNAADILHKDNPAMDKLFEAGWKYVNPPIWTEHILVKNDKGDLVFQEGMGNTVRPAHY